MYEKVRGSAVMMTASDRDGDFCWISVTSCSLHRVDCQMYAPLQTSTEGLGC